MSTHSHGNIRNYCNNVTNSALDTFCVIQLAISVRLTYPIVFNVMNIKRDIKIINILKYTNLLLLICGLKCSVIIKGQNVKRVRSPCRVMWHLRTKYKCQISKSLNLHYKNNFVLTNYHIIIKTKHETILFVTPASVCMRSFCSFLKIT